MTIAVDLGRKATKTNKQTNKANVKIGLKTSFLIGHPEVMQILTLR